MNNLLLITDVARLQTIFGRLTEDKDVRLYIANDLEKGGEAISTEQPDYVFVQTHLSGLSPEILLMHLKKQLGQTSSSFVLLATPAQVNESTLTQYQSWIDTSTEDEVLLEKLYTLLEPLSPKIKESAETNKPEASDFAALNLFKTFRSSVNDIQPAAEEAPAQPVPTNATVQPVAVTRESTLEEQGITYSARQRITVQSEFNSSFDTAVNSAPEPTFMADSAPTPDKSWDNCSYAKNDLLAQRSKKLTFLLWLVPIIIVVTVATIFQHFSSQQTPSLPGTATKPAGNATTSSVHLLSQILSAKQEQSVLNNVSSAKRKATKASTDSVVQSSDKSVINAIAENSTKRKKIEPAVSTAVRLINLPEFIPIKNIEKSYSIANPGWERYTSANTDYRVYREKDSIKAIQIIALGGINISKPFLNRILTQLVKNPHFVLTASELKEGYRIERGSLANNLKAVFYRDEQGGKLQALVLTWE